MARYMSQFAYTSDAWATLVQNPQNRADAVGQLAEKFGARLIDLYYAFGDYDGVIITEAPDDVTVTAMILAAIAPGHVKSIKTTRLLTVEEAMEAMRRAGDADYRAPEA